jgi:predicted ATP-dependent endonuclease of OLD family
MSKEGLRFESLEVENFKNIEKKIVSIGGRSFIVTGQNAAGKSSLIQALLSPMDSKVKQPKKAIMDGKDKASTKVVIKGEIGGEEHEYTLEMFYTPGNQTGRLVIRNSAGEALKSPAKTLDAIVGNIAFDMFKFLNGTGPAKVKVIKELAGIVSQIDALDAQRKEKMADKLFKTRSCEEKEAIMKNHGLSQDDIEKYSESIHVEPINEELANISKKIESYARIKNGVQKFKDDNLALNADNVKYEKEITELEAKIAELKETVKANKETIEQNKSSQSKGEEWLEKNKEPNAGEISKRLSDANLHNENYNKVVELGKKQVEIVTLKKEIEKLQAEVVKIDDDKLRLIKKSKLPIKGMTFDDEQVYLNGLPMEEGQINTAELYKAGFEISKALNPNLRVIIIPEGSLFDRKSLMAVIKQADEEGYQVIAEVVSDDADVSINFVEAEA